MLLEQFLKDDEITLKELTVRLPPLDELIQDYKVGAAPAAAGLERPQPLCALL